MQTWYKDVIKAIGAATISSKSYLHVVLKKANYFVAINFFKIKKTI